MAAYVATAAENAAKRTILSDRTRVRTDDVVIALDVLGQDVGDTGC